MAIRTYSNPFISRFQSAVRSVLIDEGEPPESVNADHPIMKATCDACDVLMPDQDHPHDHTHADADPVHKTDLAKVCAKLYVGLVRARMMGDRKKVQELEDEIAYSVCDPLWAKVLLEYRKTDDVALPYRRYESLTDFVEPLPEKEKITIGFISDWGTGTPTARHVLECLAKFSPDVVIHLGDVYYSGSLREMRDNFLKPMREILPASTQIRALAGNHDLYAGGEGYYWLLDELGQPASYFCLRNEHWQILAIGAPPDKSDPQKALAHVPKIDDQEAVWHKDKIANNQDRKTVMLSHYQVFTASGNLGRDPSNNPLAINPVLHDTFRDDLANIDLWLWGHEHNMIVFDPYIGLKRGRCIGSGAIPVPLLWQPYSPRADLVLPEGIDHLPHMNHHAHLSHDGDHYHHGFGLLTLSGEKGVMTYHEVGGLETESALIYTEIL